MANTLKIKRGTNATTPQGQLAEPLFTTDTYDLYIGKGGALGNQRFQKYIASGTSSQFLKGDGTLDSTTYQATSEKGQNNGYASLDAGGKVPVAQLPNSIMEYLGTWDASTNTPTLANGTGNAGDVYICSVGGTVNFGAGPITFAVGDWVVYSGSVWQKSINSNAVASVNGQTGAVVLYTDDISEDGSPVNLWFTNARARTAISLTTTGTSGAATYDNSTGIINIPQYQGVLTNPVTGTGTINEIAFFNITGSTIASLSTATYPSLTELSYVKGVTSAIQTQLDGKQAQLNGTGFVKASGTTISYDNSTYLTTSSAASTYLPLAGGTMTGQLVVSYNAASEPYVNAIFRGGSSAIGGILTNGLNQAHIRFQVGSTTWDGAGSKQWQIRVGNGAGQDNMKIYSWTYGDDVMTMLSDATIRFHKYTTDGFVKFSSSNGTLSVDTNTYLTTSSAASTYLPLSGGTLTGNLTLGGGSDLIITPASSGGNATLYNDIGNLQSTATIIAPKIGINVSSSPSERLVVGQSSGNSSAAYFYTSGVATGQSFGLAVYAGTNASDRSAIFVNQAGTLTHLLIRGDGNLGMDSNISAWNSAAKTITVNTRSTFGAIGNDMHISSNAYYNSSAQWKTIEASSASNYYQTNGQHVFRVFSSSTADQTISWINALTIANTGAATFSSHINMVATKSLQWDDGSIINSTSGDLKFYTGALSGLRLTISSTGAATFSSSVRSNSHMIVSDGSASVVLQGYINNALRIAASGSGSSGGSRGGLYVGAIDVEGSATFSSSVYATNYIINEASANRGGLYPYNRVLGSGTDYSVGIFSEGEIFMAPGGGTTKRLVMTSGGNVGIGTTSPTSPLTIEGANDGSIYAHIRINATGTYPNNIAGLAFNNSGVQQNIRFLKNGTEKFQIRYNEGSTETNKLNFYSFITGTDMVIFDGNNGEVLINTGTDAGNYKLQVNGNVLASGYFESSDIRLKDVLTNSYSENFSAIEFMWKDNRDDRKHWGYAAQDVMKYIPDAIEVNKDGMMTVNYNEAHTWKIAQLEKEILEIKAKLK